jgi:outer membrane usher protein
MRCPARRREKARQSSTRGERHRILEAIYAISLKLFRHIILILIIVLSIPVTMQAATVPLKVFMNTVDKGELFVSLTTEDDILLSPEQLKELGFKGAPEKADIKEELISLKSLSPEVGFTLDVQESTLFLTVSPELLLKQAVDLGTRRPENVTHPKGNSAFLNYSINYSMDDQFDFQALNVPLEIGGRTGDYLFESNFFYTGTDAENKFVRLMTNIIKDNPEKIIRYTAGDFFASSGVLGGSAMLGGVSIMKNFSTNPYFVRYPGLQLSGLLNTPSQVDLYMNNVLVKHAKLASGEFDFSNLYSQTGAGNTVLVIKDAFGREERITTPFYLSTNLLKPGLHDYGYNLGFKRQDFGEKNFRYGEAQFLGFHRYGFTDIFTGGVRGEADKDMINLGPTATFLAGQAGVIDSGLAFSRGGGKYGYAAFADYTYNNTFFSGNASFSRFSEDYTNLSLEGGSPKPRFQAQAGIGFNLRELGSISTSVQVFSHYHEPGIKRESAFYSRNLGHNVSLSVSAARMESASVTYEFFAGLVFTLGNNNFGTVTYQDQDSYKSLSASIEKNTPAGPGFGYRLQANAQKDEDRTFRANSYVQYNGPYGSYSASARRVSGANSYDLSLSGAMEFIDQSVYFSRPINDSFALVKIDDVAGAKIYYSNNEVAVTNGKGEAIVPSLISYNDNKLSFEATDIPINYELKEMEKYIAPPYRSGSVVRFDLAKIQAFEGRIFLVARGEKIPAEFAGLEIMVDGEVKEAVIGKRGEFYMENLNPGRFPAKIIDGDKECVFEMVVPESMEITVKLGDMNCEMD